MPDVSNWDPEQDEWQLFDSRNDYSLMNNLASENSEKLEEMKALFMQQAKENKVPRRWRPLHCAQSCGDETQYRTPNGRYSRG